MADIKEILCRFNLKKGFGKFTHFIRRRIIFMEKMDRFEILHVEYI